MGRRNQEGGGTARARTGRLISTVPGRWGLIMLSIAGVNWIRLVAGPAVSESSVSVIQSNLPLSLSLLPISS